MLFIFYILQFYRNRDKGNQSSCMPVNWSTGPHRITRRRHASEHTLVCPYDDGVSPQPLPAQVFHCHSEGVQVDAAHHRSPEPDALEPCQHQLSHSAAAAACDFRRFAS